MFRCDLDGKVVGPNIPPVKLITKIRKRSYENVKKKEEPLTTERVSTTPRWEKAEIFVTQGWEILREVNACPDCAEKHKDLRY